MLEDEVERLRERVRTLEVEAEAARMTVAAIILEHFPAGKIELSDLAMEVVSRGAALATWEEPATHSRVIMLLDGDRHVPV